MAIFFLAGEAEAPTGNRISVLVGASGCPCGCGRKGMAFTWYLGPDEARTVANRLLELADEHEAAAAEQATALIAKVRRP